MVDLASPACRWFSVAIATPARGTLANPSIGPSDIAAPKAASFVRGYHHDPPAPAGWSAASAALGLFVATAVRADDKKAPEVPPREGTSETISCSTARTSTAGRGTRSTGRSRTA